MFNPAGLSGVTIKPVDGGFIVSWLERKEIDYEKHATAMPGSGSPMLNEAMAAVGHIYPKHRMVQREAVRANMKEALEFVSKILTKKMAEKAGGSLDDEDLGAEFFGENPA